MFPLAGKTFPQSADDLTTAIHDALAEVIEMPRKSSAVSIEGGKWPDLKHVKVDLSGAKISASQPPPAPPKARGKRQPGISVDRLDVLGHPLRVETSDLDLTLRAQEVAFDFAHDPAGGPMLVLTDAKSGHVEVKIAKKDLQAILLAGATVAAKQQGVSIQDLQISLTSEGPRSLAAEVRVKAKKMVMSGTITVRGKVDIDDKLVATLSSLACTGEGMIGGMAASFVGAKLKTVEGKRVPLMAFSLGDVALRDLKISAADPIKVSAEFGRSA